jgi:hypothetical protein
MYENYRQTVSAYPYIRVSTYRTCTIFWWAYIVLDRAVWEISATRSTIGTKSVLTLRFFTGSRQGLSGGTGDIYVLHLRHQWIAVFSLFAGVEYSVFSSNWSFFFDFGVFLDDTGLAGVQLHSVTTS